MKKVTAKFGSMRKAENFTVYPRPTNVGDDYSKIDMMSEHRHVRFDTVTGHGVLSAYAVNYPNVGKGVDTAIILSPELIKEIQAAQPKKGDVLFGGVLVIG